MTQIQGPIAPATALPMKGRLLNCLPGIRWVPHDIPSAEASNRAHKSHRSLFSRKHSEEKGKMMNRDAAFPDHRRKSTISITSTPDPELDARTHAQGQSDFFAKLPLEVRKMVYEYVMGKETIHLTLGAKKRFGHFVCEDTSKKYDENVPECECKVLVGGKESRRLHGVLSVLKTCRRMYTEAIPHLYTPHTFSLLHVTHLLYIPTRIPQARLDTIRTLRLRWAIRALPYLRRPIQQKRFAYPEDTANWQRGWRILSGMKGLRDLWVMLIDPSPQGIWETSWSSLQERLLEDIGVVKQIRSGVVFLPYPSCDVDVEIEGCAIKFRKPGDGEKEEVDQ